MQGYKNKDEACNKPHLCKNVFLELVYFILFSTHFLALTNASIHGVTWSLLRRSAG